MAKRKLRSSANFCNELKALPNRGRLADVLTGLCTCIERDAESFYQVGKAPVRVYLATTLPFSGMPAYRVLFWIVNSHTAELESIAEIPDE